jgi:DeoR/GlpR family transcriptional regulator of sugar metabolism
MTHQGLPVTLIPAAKINDGVRSHVSVAEAARILGVSEASIRRAARKAGVQKIAGRTVRGGILIQAYPVPLVITYSA